MSTSSGCKTHIHNTSLLLPFSDVVFVSSLKPGARWRFYHSLQSATCFITRCVCLQCRLGPGAVTVTAPACSPGSGLWTRQERLGLGCGELPGSPTSSRFSCEVARCSTSLPRFGGSPGNNRPQCWTAVFSPSLLEIKTPKLRRPGRRSALRHALASVLQASQARRRLGKACFPGPKQLHRDLT